MISWDRGNAQIFYYNYRSEEEGAHGHLTITIEVRRKEHMFSSSARRLTWCVAKAWTETCSA
jgi:hypothetical protein